MKPVLATAVGFALTLLIGTAHASCTGADRIAYQYADCLEASWDNNCGTKGGFSCYSVRNLCPEFGTVVAKIDVKDALDLTLHLKNGMERKGTVGSHNLGIRWIHCCRDLSDRCFLPRPIIEPHYQPPAHR